MPDILQPLLMVALGVGAGWLLFYLRTTVFAYHPQPDTPLSTTLATLGFRRTRKGYIGKIDAHRVTVTALAQNGYHIMVQTPKSFEGDVKLSGPSENASGALPEVKIRMGDGDFDHHFWVALSKPREAASKLLMPHENTREMLLDMPFGTWTFTANVVSYETYKVALVNLPGVIQKAVTITKSLST